MSAIRLIENAIEIDREAQVKVMFTTEPDNFDFTSQATNYESNAFLLKSTDTLQLAEKLQEQGLV
ncbi:MAG: hypothetical protein GX434_01150 [Peptococcaceae bacterium]|nr:hypothetical protein [Peptococcaceae bacterium]